MPYSNNVCNIKHILEKKKSYSDTEVWKSKGVVEVRDLNFVYNNMKIVFRATELYHLWRQISELIRDLEEKSNQQREWVASESDG